MSYFPAQAQFPINEPFTGTEATTPNFVLGGTASLGTGYLRLTSNVDNQAGYAILKNTFSSRKGFSISFEFSIYGGTGPSYADGISVFLVDADGTDPTTNPPQFNIGAYGGSLGYGQKTKAAGASTDIPGATKGYLGIGLDEYGNYSTTFEGLVGGGTNRIPQSVALRGPADPDNPLGGYAFLTTSGTLPFDLNVSTARAQVGSPDYRKAYIYVVPTNGGYNVTVRIQHGATITTTTSNYAVKTPPENLRIGFAGSTGNFNNIHEIRYLTVLDNPVAVDDVAQTRYDKAVIIPILKNDRGIAAALDSATVDLDPNTAGRQIELLVADKGTFVVNDKGVVTFTPLGTFSGVVSIPYVVSDVLRTDTDLRLSNPATISVTVTGADVATSVTGPATALPGSQVTYTVSTTNIGLETATNVIPTLLLPPGLTIATSADYTYDSMTGLVTFNQATLTANQTTSNSVVVSMPSSGTITATSNYTYPTAAAIPDPVSANNSATIRTTVTGLSTVITTCATPGKDGPATLDNTSVPNTYYPGISTATTGGVLTTITVGKRVGMTPVTVGDLVLVMQMQDGANMSTTNSASYGTLGSTTAGQYEYAAVTSVVNSADGSTFTLSKLLTNIYTTTAGANTAGANQNFQVIRVPQYSVLTIDGTVTGTAWNSTTKTGGVLALDVVGTTTFTTGSGLSMNAKGFSGGGGVSYAGAGTGTGATNSTDDYATSTTLGAHGAKGEGIAGTPHYYYNGTAVVNNQVEGYPTGDDNIGAPANGGGGAQDFAPATNTGNSGGGGGANAGVGGLGGYGYDNTTGSTGNRAIGGRTFSGTAMALIMGGGGGAGSTNTTNTAVNSSGGIGGGIIILRTNTTSGTATIQANGGDAASAGTLSNQGGGGGGAGGSVLVLATATGSNITTSANGGNGSSVNTTPGAASYGPGGGGSGGFVYTSGTLGTVTSTHGANGQTNNGQPDATAALVDFGATDGADGITNSTITAPNTNTMGGTSSCYPDLSMALSTSTPNVTRSSSGPNPAMYTATISNVGGAAYNTSTTIALSPLFAYDASLTPTLTLTTASGTTTTLAPSDYSVTGTTSPVFSGLFIPSGTTLSITFRATISANAENNTPYQADASVVYANPTRTTTNSADADASAPGNGYASASSTAEDVTIVTPLPVDLTRFDVLAIRQDAVLSWTTASELHNDHFTVERSTTGSKFLPIGTVRGAGTSVRTTEYSFIDNGAGRLAAETVYYRLQQVDLEGNTSYSPVRTVHFAATKATAVLYPNPSQGQITLDLSTLATGTYTVQVLDLAGRVVRTQQSSAVAAPLDLSGLPQGAYVVMIQGANVRQALPLLRN
ncbi:MAG: T9SS type A sorting domain-containing protein [Janthinobacterium lividum]